MHNKIKRIKVVKIDHKLIPTASPNSYYGLASFRLSHTRFRTVCITWVPTIKRGKFKSLPLIVVLFRGLASYVSRRSHLANGSDWMYSSLFAPTICGHIRI